jgi:hypothetical protein
MRTKRIVLPRFNFERDLLEVFDHIKAELDGIPVNCIGKMLLNTQVHERCKRLRASIVLEPSTMFRTAFRNVTESTT